MLHSSYKWKQKIVAADKKASVVITVSTIAKKNYSRLAAFTAHYYSILLHAQFIQ